MKILVLRVVTVNCSITRCRAEQTITLQGLEGFVPPEFKSKGWLHLQTDHRTPSSVWLCPECAAELPASGGVVVNGAKE